MRSEGKIRSVLLLQPRHGDYAALVELFRRNDILGLAMREAGCLAAELQVPVSGLGPVLVTALWESEVAYAGWRTHPARDVLSGEMERLTEAEAAPVGSGLYRVEVAGAAAPRTT
jgi:heme-degrading monooxygenase HmoA